MYPLILTFECHIVPVFLSCFILYVGFNWFNKIIVKCKKNPSEKHPGVSSEAHSLKPSLAVSLPKIHVNSTY